MVDQNTLFYGDNLDILQHHIPTESIDLVYLDPPFNSKRDYNVLFKERSGESSPAQIEAFTDTWSWDRSAEKTYSDLVHNAPANVAEMIGALTRFIGHNDMMAYLVMMAARLVELHRVLKPTGSLYLHCDPTTSHYLKIILDTVFGKEQFRNEIIWERFGAHNDARRYGRVTDTILFYSRTKDYQFNLVRAAYSQDHLETRFRQVDQDGRRFWANTCLAPGGRGPRYDWHGHTRNWRFTRENMERLDAEGSLYHSASGMPYRKNYLDELPGQAVQNLWTDIKMTRSGAERLGYPTQKPLALLERIIAASSNPGDVVLDPFCGCGTAVVAAEKLSRRWIGIDITHLAITLMKVRLLDSFPGIEFTVKGEPADIGSARMLAEADRYQFQWWALSLVRAKPTEGREKKGSDKGIDGVIVFADDHTGHLKRCLVQVKSGKVQAGDVRDLRGTMTREGAELGLFVTLDTSTQDMRKEAAMAGMYLSEGWQREYPRIQIATIGDLLAGVLPAIPYGLLTFTKAPRVGIDPSERQATFDLPSTHLPSSSPRSS
jgi:site-specific DNA-methyltransferase (adenine-specific)